MRELWTHQKIAFHKYKDRDFFGLLFSCGIGKTQTTISIAEEKNLPVLIIAPDCLCKQWAECLKDEEQTERKWEVVLCTSKTKKKKNFQEALDKLLETF